MAVRKMLVEAVQCNGAEVALCRTGTLKLVVEQRAEVVDCGRRELQKLLGFELVNGYS